MTVSKFVNTLKTRPLLILLFASVCFNITKAQVPVNDSAQAKRADSIRQAITVNKQTEKDLRKYKAVYDSSFSPKKATIRSAIFPGLGQIYNKQYWKLPVVYGAVGATAGIFFVNLSTYKDLRQAYILKTDNDTANDKQIPYYISNLSANGLKTNRDIYRRNIDYSVLVFLLAWGLNVVDATVSAHLKQFDVSDDLSLKVKPILGLDGRMGVGLVMNFK